MKFIRNLSLLIANGGVMLCCVLPALLVTFGFGGVLVTFLGEYPLFIEISRHKGWIFFGAFLILLLSGFSLYANREQVCQVNSLSKECVEVKTASKILYIISLIIFITSLYLSYGF